MFSHLAPPPPGQKGLTLAQVQQKQAAPSSTFTGDVASALKTRGVDLNTTLQSNQTPISKGLQILGQGAGFVMDTVGAGIKKVVNALPNAKAENATLAQDPLIQLGAHALSAGGDVWSSFKAAHPEIAGDAGALANIAALLSGGGGAEAVGEGAIDTIPQVVDTVKSTASTAKGVSAVANDARDLKDTIDIVSPKITPVDSAADIAAGKGAAPTFFGKAAIDQSETPYIQKAAQDVRGLVSKKDSMIQNVNNVHDAITHVANNVVRPFLTANKVPFNFEDLQKSLDLVKPSSSLKSDPTAFTTYGRVKNEIQQTMYDALKQNPERENLTDMNNLWDARKAVDTKINQELGDATFGTSQYAGVKAAARDMRNAVNTFMTNSIANPGQMEKVNAMSDFLQTARSRGMDISSEADAMKALGKQFGLSATDADAAKAAFFKSNLSKMNGMYDAISNMAPKAYAEVGKTGVSLLMKQHPVLKKLIGAGLSGVGLGLGFKGIESL